MAEEFLDGSDVSAVLQEVGREGVTEGVGRDALVQASRYRGPSYGALRGAFVEVVTPQFVGAGITRGDRTYKLHSGITSE